MVSEVGGVENRGFTLHHCYNHVERQKMMMIEIRDGQSLVNHFKHKAEEKGIFY